MPSELDRLAAAIRDVGASSGSLRPQVASAGARARSLATTAHQQGREGAQVAAALMTAHRQTGAATSALQRFGAKSEGFADRLAHGSSGAHGDCKAGTEDREARIEAARAKVQAAYAEPTLSGDAQLTDRLSALGLTMLPVADATFYENPILSWPHGVKETDVTWAVERWDSVVSGLVAGGGTKEELSQRDAAEGTVGSLRQLARVYEIFLGDHPITVSPRGDGTYSVGDGRHRLYVAKKLGIHSLPVRVLGTSSGHGSS